MGNELANRGYAHSVHILLFPEFRKRGSPRLGYEARSQARFPDPPTLPQSRTRTRIHDPRHDNVYSQLPRLNFCVLLSKRADAGC